MSQKCANSKSPSMDLSIRLRLGTYILISVSKLVKNGEEPCIYKWTNGSIVVYLVLYVDDILLIENDIPTL